MRGNSDDLTKVGPKMAALPNDKWRAFVRLHIARPREHGERNVREAGFAGRSSVACRVQAHRLLHDERVQEAIIEESRRGLVTLAPAAVLVAGDILADKTEKASDRLMAAKAIFDRSGLHGLTEHKTTVQLRDDPDQLRRIAALIAMLGLPTEIEAQMREKLLGPRLSALAAPVIQAQVFEKVEPEEG